jgi:hypothetical protein
MSTERAHALQDRSDDDQKRAGDQECEQVRLVAAGRLDDRIARRAVPGRDPSRRSMQRPSRRRPTASRVTRVTVDLSMVCSVACP